MAKFKRLAAIAVAMIVGLGFSVQAAAGEYKYHLGKQACRSEVRCMAYTEPTTFRVLAQRAKSFDEFKRLNKLPHITPDTKAPANVMFAYKRRVSSM